MSILKNIHIKKNLIFFVFLKIVTIIILIWTDHFHGDVYNYGRTIEDKNKRGSSLNIRFERYLAEYEGEAEIDKTALYINSPYYFENKGTSNYDDNVSIYGNIKNRDSIKLNLYKTGYKHRYAKKKGLSKLDCYYEKKVFDKIDYIYDLAKKMRNDKKSFKKKIYNKFAIPLFVFALLPLLGIIFPILFEGKFGERLIPWTRHKCPTYPTSRKDGNCGLCPKGYYHLFTGKYSFSISYCFNAIISCILIFMVITVIFYTLIKVIKYEALKAGKGKMNRKEYITFCKELLKNK
ncbi:hypothetical protein PVBG_06152 [Plasmodium vivax Brazil I]|uniref:Uncharacterized protein n=2 Tax=Plasmodium vivax TaxID=5855 RepID=A0A0J9SJU9_PLAV1|nr:hypothetical protein PVBG_06152 [Plasmodium vivax Brazil I]